jgi:hypothetical protein
MCQSEGLVQFIAQWYAGCKSRQKFYSVRSQGGSVRKQITGTLTGMALMMVSGTTSAVVLAEYDFKGSVAPTTVDSSLSASDLGAFGITGNLAGDTFNIIDSDANAGDYLYFTLTPANGYTLNLDSLSFTATRSANGGVITIQAKSSLDSTNFLNFSLPVSSNTVTLPNRPSVTTVMVDLSGTAFDAIGSEGITFQLYFTSDNANKTRYTSIDTVTVNGTAMATVQLPPAAWLMGSGLLGLIGIGRRKLS